MKNPENSRLLFIITGDVSGRFDPTYLLSFEALLLTSSTPPVTAQYVAGRRRISGLKFRPPKLPRLIRAFPLRIGLRGSYESCSLRCDAHSGKIWWTSAAPPEPAGKSPWGSAKKKNRDIYTGGTQDSSIMYKTTV